MEEYIIDLANQARSRINVLYPIDPIPIAKTYGVYVFRTRLPVDISSKVHVEEKKIYISSTDYITRQVFSVAHELGHILLKHDIDQHSSVKDTISTPTTDPIELEANLFASNLLMPQDEILKLIGNRYTLDSMSSYFNVSSFFMVHRLQHLKLDVYI